MDEIPGFVWVIVGVFIFLMSLFLGFFRDEPTSGFFKLMFVVGIGMLVYGYIFKIRLGSKSKEDILGERKQQLMKERGDYEVDIDIDDYRNNPYKKQEIVNKGYPQTGPSQQFKQMERQFQQNIAQQNQRKNPPSNPGMQAPTQQQHYSSAQVTIQRQQGQRFCPACKTPLLKEHKSCPICGGRV